MKIDEFDYFLPKELIAQQPYPKRDECRLLVLHKDNGEVEHRIFRDIIHFLKPQDALVINTTKVIPARLKGKKEKTEGKVEVFLLKKLDEDTWECILRPYRKVKEGTVVVFPKNNLKAYLLQRTEKNTGIVKFVGPQPSEKALFEVGEVPLPPYIKRENGPTSRDEREYQTVYAEDPGAVAAPTAGLHFTFELLEAIKKKGVEVVKVVLHTGWASFFSLREPEVKKNSLPSEYFKISSSAAKKINFCKEKGGKIVAVGTTTVRALESSFHEGKLYPGEGWTDLFIYPGYKFKVVDALITNFHLPKSSLLLLVAAFIGKEKLMSAYKEAVVKGYRFLSYGDAMLII